MACPANFGGDGTGGPVRPEVIPFGAAPPLLIGDLVSNSPLVSMTGLSPGPGLRLAAADGGVFALGGASFLGTVTGLEGRRLVGITSTPVGNGVLGGN